MLTQTGRPAMRSPGRPPVRRDLERAFWRKIAEGMTSEDAAVAVGVSGPVGSRWFRERGGMATFLITPVTGRNLSSEEREVMALLKAQDPGVREIARQLGRHPSTVRASVAPVQLVAPHAAADEARCGCSGNRRRG